MRIGIIGGGLMGLALAERLGGDGHRADISTESAVAQQRQRDGLPALRSRLVRSDADLHRFLRVEDVEHRLPAGEDAVDEVVDLYFRQCSIQVTAADLARMGSTLANIGENPVTRRQVFDLTAVRNTLAVMFTCGMYDYSGQWAYRVGVPAKSGVAGGVMAVVNRQLGIATYSPRLDRYGNSCRGIEACTELASRLGLHVFDCLNIGSGFLDTIL